MNDASLRLLDATPVGDVPCLGSLWLASEPIRVATAAFARIGRWELFHATDPDRLHARLAGIGVRASPDAPPTPPDPPDPPDPADPAERMASGDSITLDALARAARDALARARRPPESIDAIAGALPPRAWLEDVVPSCAGRIAESEGDPLGAAVRAIESGSACRVLVLERPLGAVAQAAVVESTAQGSPPFAHGAWDAAGFVPTSPIVAQADVSQALRAFGLDVPVPQAMTVGLVVAARRVDDARVTRVIRDVALRGTVLAVAPDLPFHALVERARRAIASGQGTAFVVAGDGRAAVVASAGFRRANTPDAAATPNG